jgi:hypothetical protein
MNAPERAIEFPYGYGQDFDCQGLARDVSNSNFIEVMQQIKGILVHAVGAGTLKLVLTIST